MIEIAQRLGISVVEASIRVDSLPEADGILSSSTRGLMPIVELDPGGRVGIGELPCYFWLYGTLTMRDCDAMTDEFQPDRPTIEFPCDGYHVSVIADTCEGRIDP